MRKGSRFLWSILCFFMMTFVGFGVSAVKINIESLGYCDLREVNIVYSVYPVGKGIKFSITAVNDIGESVGLSPLFYTDYSQGNSIKAIESHKESLHLYIGGLRLSENKINGLKIFHADILGAIYSLKGKQVRREDWNRINTAGILYYEAIQAAKAVGCTDEEQSLLDDKVNFYNNNICKVFYDVLLRQMFRCSI